MARDSKAESASVFRSAASEATGVEPVPPSCSIVSSSPSITPPSWKVGGDPEADASAWRVSPQLPCGLDGSIVMDYPRTSARGDRVSTARSQPSERRPLSVRRQPTSEFCSPIAENGTRAEEETGHGTNLWASGHRRLPADSEGRNIWCGFVRAIMSCVCRPPWWDICHDGVRFCCLFRPCVIRCSTHGRRTHRCAPRLILHCNHEYPSCGAQGSREERAKMGASSSTPIHALPSAGSSGLQNAELLLLEAFAAATPEVSEC